MASYVQRLDFNKKENTCGQCIHGCEDLDNYYHNPKICLIRQEEKKNGEIIK